jgi:hypothetical protein
MRTFKDNAGRTWTISLTVAAVKRVRDLARLDLLDLANGRVIERLVADPVALCDALYAACKPQADAEGVTDEQFGEAMAGDAIEHASKALVEELVQFFPNARERAALSRVVRTMDAAMDRARTLVERRIESGEIERAIEQAMADTTGAPTAGPSSIGSPVSSASIPAA